MDYEKHLYHYCREYFNLTLPGSRARIEDAFQKGLVEGIDYPAVWAEVAQGVIAYLEGRAAEVLEAEGVRLYQLALHVDVKAQIAHLHMETRANAEAEVAKVVRRFHETAPDDTYAAVLETPYNRDTNTFQFHDATWFPLPSLNRVQLISDPACLRLMEQHVEYGLVRTVDRIIVSNLLARLPCEPEVWIGITTPALWFDHVVMLNGRGEVVKQ